MKKLIILAFVLMSANAMASTQTVNRIAPACIEKEQIESLIHLAKDVVAFKKQFMLLIIARQCTVFDAGEVINIDEVSFSGLTQVRKTGDFVKYWMTSEFLR